MAREALGEKNYVEPSPRRITGPEYEAVWREVVHDFPPEHFRESDRWSIHNYVDITCRLKDAQERLDREGLMIIDAKGVERENPLLDVVVRLSRTSLTYARALKIVPIARMSERGVPAAPAKSEKNPVAAGLALVS